MPEYFKRSVPSTSLGRGAARAWGWVRYHAWGKWWMRGSLTGYERGQTRAHDALWPPEGEE